MKLVKQLAIFLANKPGTMARVTDTLSEANINILGVMVADAVDHAVLRIVVDQPEKAIHLLGDGGLLVLESDIFELELPNKPGMLSELGKTLSDMGINIEYAYGAVKQDADKGLMYVKVSNPNEAMDILKHY